MSEINKTNNIKEVLMYRCGNKPEIGDCVAIQVDIEVEEMSVRPGDIAMVVEMQTTWGGNRNPLLTIKLPSDEIQQIPSSWCTLCQRK